MTDREGLDKRAAALNLKVPARTGDAKLKEMIAAAEAEMANAGEADVDCRVLSNVLHDGRFFVAGDRIKVTPAQFGELSGAGAVSEIAETPAASRKA